MFPTSAKQKTELAPSQACRFTAAEIAAALGITKQAVRKALGNQSPCLLIKIKGQPTAAFSLAALPAQLLQRLTEVAHKRGCKNVAALLANPPKQFTAPIPFTRLSEGAQSEAMQWRDILAPLLARQHSTSPAALLADGIANAHRILGESISADTFRRHFDLAVQRDNGFEQWQNLDLYVAPAAYQSCAANLLSSPILNVPPSTLWPDLSDRIAELENKLAPTAEDRAHLLDAAFRQLEALTSANVCTLREPKIKQRLTEILLQSVPALAKTLAALRRNFDRKLTAWRIGGRKLSAILDARDNSGRKAKKLCVTCRDLVKGAAVELDGDLAQAWRRLQLPPNLGGVRAEGKGLCDTCAGLWHYNVRGNKSYVPASVRADLWPEIEPALVHRHGPKTAKLSSPYIRRDWSDIGPGDFFEADDVTLNHYWYEQDEQGRFYVGRGECLVLIDRRTDYPIAYLMISGLVDDEGKQQKAVYNATHVRKLILRGNDSIGLPHRGFVFENGIWAARLIDGEPMHGWEFNGWRRTEHGLRDSRLGLPIADAVRHAEAGNPRTKRIEGVFAAVQNRMRPQIGFAGFDERHDKREKLQDFLRRVRAGNEHPGNELPSKADYLRLLDSELIAFASEPQNGNRLPGVSPFEAWRNGIGGKPGIAARPLRKLQESDRAWLASHRRTAPVTNMGIRLRIGSQVRVFWSDDLKPYQNRIMPVAVNLEEPELLHCFPQDGKPFTVRERFLPSSSATREQLSEASASRRRWVKSGKVAFDNLPHPLRFNIVRDGQHGPQADAEGDFINRETEQHRDSQRTERTQAKRIARVAKALGADVVINPRRASQQAEALERMQRRQQLQQPNATTL